MADFGFTAAKTKEQALQILQELGSNARIAAGCTNVLPNIQTGKLKQGVLVDISGLEELKQIDSDGERVTIGALTTINQLVHSEVIKENAMILVQAGQQFADPLVRNRATLAGNLANASPAADGVVPLLALDAVIKLESLSGGVREIPAAQFFTGPGKTDLKPGELIISVSFPSTRKLQGSFIKFGLRKSMAISIITVAAVLGLKDGAVSQARIAMGAVASTPVRLKKTEEFLLGQQVDEYVLAKAGEIVISEIDPISDLRASREYRLHLARVLLKRAVASSVELGGSNCGNLS